MPRLDAGATVLDRKRHHRQTRGDPTRVRPRRQRLVQGRTDQELAPVGHGVHGIEQQVDQHLAELHGIHINRQRAIVGAGLQLDPARNDLGGELGYLFKQFIQVMVIPLTRLAVMQADDPMHQLARLPGIVHDQGHVLTVGITRLDLMEELLAQRADAGHQIAEIMGQPHRQHRQSFLPGGGRKPALGNRLPGDVEPKAFVAEHNAVGRHHRIPVLMQIRDPARRRVANAVGE